MGPHHDVSEISNSAEAELVAHADTQRVGAADGAASAVNSVIAPGMKRSRETGMPELPKTRMRLNFCSFRM